MCHGTSGAIARHGTYPRQEGSLTQADFVGSYPSADFRVVPPLPEIAFLGRSNVGKSSLINTLLNRRTLARTSRTPGKTRMCTVFRVAERYYLIDLPGYGYAQVSKSERAGFGKLIAELLNHRKTLSAAVWLLDVRHEPSKDDIAIGALVADSAVPVLVVGTKADKLGKRELQKKGEAISSALGIPIDQLLVTSSTAGTGIEELRESIDEFVGS